MFCLRGSVLPPSFEIISHVVVSYIDSSTIDLQLNPSEYSPILTAILLPLLSLMLHVYIPR